MMGEELTDMQNVCICPVVFELWSRERKNQIEILSSISRVWEKLVELSE